MQSKTSFFNKALFKKNISRTWIAGLLYFVLLLIFIPTIFIINTADKGNGDYYSRMGYTMEMRLYEHMASIPTVTFAIVISIITTGITFWYLFNRRDSYMMHAFPVSRRCMYFTGILSSLTVSIVPVILTSIIMSIAAVVQGATGVSCVWFWALIVIVSTLLFTSIAIFSLMITGQIVTGIIFYFIFNFLYIMMEIAFRLTASILVYGLSQAMNGINYKPWTPYLYIQQHVRVVSNIVMDDNYEHVVSFSPELSGVHLLVIYAVVAIAITIATYQIYRFKKLETVLDFIAVPFMKPVFSVGMSFFISMVAGAFVAGMVESFRTLSYDGRYAIAIVSALIIGAIIYFATQMLIEKTLRVFCMKKAIHCATYTLAAFGILLCMRLDVLGIESRVPRLQDIQWAGISIDQTMVFTDEMEIEAFRQVHQNFLADRQELRNINYNYSDVDGKTFSIRYKLKNGDIVIREYPVINTESEVVSPEYVAAAQPVLDFVNNPARIKQHIIGNFWNDCEVTAMEFGVVVDYDNEIDGMKYGTEYKTFDELSTKEKKAKFKRVYNALLEDIDAGKVWQQTFAGYDYQYKANQKKTVYNGFDFVIYNKDIPYFSDTYVFWDNGNEEISHQQNIYAELNTGCTNVLKALKDEGFYEKDEDILTYYEYNQKYERDDSYDAVG